MPSLQAIFGTCGGWYGGGAQSASVQSHTELGALVAATYGDGRDPEAVRRRVEVGAPNADAELEHLLMNRTRPCVTANGTKWWVRRGVRVTPLREPFP